MTDNILDGFTAMRVEQRDTRREGFPRAQPFDMGRTSHVCYWSDNVAVKDSVRLCVPGA